MHLSSWLGKPVELPFDEELYKAELFKRVEASGEKKEVADVSSVTDMDSTF